MADFGIRFFLNNILICVIIGFLIAAKRILNGHLTSRMQFDLWFLLLGILAVPFIPFPLVRSAQVLAWLGAWKDEGSASRGAVGEDAQKTALSGAVAQMNDFALSVSRKTPSAIGLLLCGIWLAGIVVMVMLVMRSVSRLNAIKRSALPLQDKTVRRLYEDCRKEMKIKGSIPIYSTAFLRSPILAGLIRPRIYLPIHLISDLDVTDMRYILLHELQHHKHKDALVNGLMALFGVLYWCDPLVWYALKEMRDEREIACDASVLALLDESGRKAYGDTLINLAEKVSFTPFPFAAGVTGSMEQMRRRIANIASYQKPSARKKRNGLAAFAVIGAILFELAPMLSTYAAESGRYRWDISWDKISLVDLSAYFNGYEGSFVLYDRNNDTWAVYDMERSTLRTAPDSTYKIYDALFGLEEGVITPDDPFMAWDGVEYPFGAWNKDQDLHSAMDASVNWYFLRIDEQIGRSAVRDHIRRIGYGNEAVDPDLSAYWMQGALKISPVEQVELLTALLNDRLGFAPENVEAVKDSICLFSSEGKRFYGKTGTGRVDGQDVNGWFIGCVEAADGTYFFATNIQSTENATGSRASQISLAILSAMDIWGA